MLAGTLMTPRIDSKIRHKFMGKCRRLDFKDILRERFNQRIKENRRTLLEKIRSNTTIDVEGTLNGYLAAEMKEFREYVIQNTPRKFAFLPNEDDFFEKEMEELIGLQEQFLEEQLSWIMDEYRREEEHIQALMSESIACPLCKRGILQKNSVESTIICTLCHLRLSSSASIDQFGSNLKHNLYEHTNRCPNDPEFVLVTEGNANSLLIICPACSLLNALN